MCPWITVLSMPQSGRLQIAGSNPIPQVLLHLILCTRYMMTSSNGNIFRVTGHLCGEFTGPRWIPHTKASDAELWCFFICVWINSWVNNGEAGDLRRYRAHYDVIVMGLEGDTVWHFEICGCYQYSIWYLINFLEFIFRVTPRKS